METRVAVTTGKLASISECHQHSGTRDRLFGAQVSDVRAAVSVGHFWQYGSFSIQSLLMERVRAEISRGKISDR
jgi:hypothetical protein